MRLHLSIIIGAMLLFLNACTMGTYKKVATECTTKSGVYKNNLKKDCFCPEKEMPCPCTENRNGYTLHAYSRGD